jgi:hypothetical protein
MTRHNRQSLSLLCSRGGIGRIASISTYGGNDFKKKVTVAICGLLAHAWSLASTWQILGKSCSNLQRSAATVAKADLQRFVVTAWCVPDLIIYVPKPKEVLVRGTALFLDLE